MPSLLIEMNHKADRQGLHVLFVRLTQGGKKKRYITDIRIPKEHFNPKAKYGRWVRTSNSKHASLNAKISDLLDSYQEKLEYAATKSGVVDISKINDRSPLDGAITIKQHFEKVQQDMKTEKSFIYYKCTKSMLERFQKFVGEETPLADIDPDHVQRFKLYLIGTKIKNVTINNIMKRIHNAFIPAIRQDLIEKDPFRAHDTLSEVGEAKQRLTDKQILALEELVLNTDKEKNWPFHTRNMYLFSYYNAGIRVADLMQLRHGDITPDGRLEYEMDKTGHKKSIKLNGAAQRILALYRNSRAKKTDYLFPVLDNDAPYASYITHSQKKSMSFELKKLLSNATSSKTSQINNNLKVLSKKIKLDKAITFHTSRHSFADKARRSMKNSNKITMYDIKNALGHKSIVTTERYINSLDKESLDEAMDDIFN